MGMNTSLVIYGLDGSVSGVLKFNERRRHTSIQLTDDELVLLECYIKACYDARADGKYRLGNDWHCVAPPTRPNLLMVCFTYLLIMIIDTKSG